MGQSTSPHVDLIAWTDANRAAACRVQRLAGVEARLSNPTPRVVLALAFAVAAAAVACRAQPAVSTTETTKAELDPSADRAVRAITMRRCEHELACERVGIGREHGDMPSCVEKVGAEVHRDVGAGACPGGIERAAVAQCLADLDRDPCGEVVAERMVSSCRRAVLCWR